jgi:hypothetical protein
MRTITLLVASILLTTGLANAQERRILNTSVTTTRFSFDEPISFTERGIEFFVFTNGDFDFNVVIRSILYNEKLQYVSFSVGSAITSKSVPEQEYDECLLKAKAMLDTLQNN